MIRFLLLIYLVFIIGITADSQNQNNHKHIPYFRTLNPEKLAHRLTNDLETDSAKVYAIHYWITHHIKYDFNKYNHYDFRIVPVKRILIQRKAICKGYCDLFNALCKYSNISSAYVTGYVKDFNVDLFDKCYLDEHVWNVVQVNNEWKLVDATWDAGYINCFRRTFVGFFIYVATLGHVNRVKYKPHFVFAPNDEYFYKDGAFFLTDHFPADPIWQLNYPIKTINQFVTDSSFYFGKYNNGKPYVSGVLDNYNRTVLMNLPSDEREITDGFTTNKFNFRNHYSVGNSFYLTGLKLISKIDTSLKDTICVKKQFDTVAYKLKEAIMHYDSNSFYLNVQKTELDSNNEEKRSIIRIQNKSLIGSTNIAYRNLTSGRILSKTLIRQSKSLYFRNNYSKLSLVHNNRFYYTDYSKKAKPNDSIIAEKNIESLYDSLKIINDTIINRFKTLDTTYKFCIGRINKYSGKSFANMGVAGYLLFLRMNQIDDLDYLIRKIKGQLLSHKYDDDSLLFNYNKMFVVKKYYNEFTVLNNDFKKLYKIHNMIASEFSKLKSSCVTKNDFKERYSENIDLYKKEIVQYNSVLNNYSNDNKNLMNLCKSQSKFTRKENESYKKELSFELKMFSVRKKHISHHEKALNRVSNSSKSEATMILRNMLKMEKAYLKNKRKVLHLKNN